MQRTLQDHISQLEQRIKGLKAHMDGSSHSMSASRELALDLANAEEALKLFRKAYELEQRVAK